MKGTVNKRKLVESCKRNGIIFLAIFGSFARGDFTKNSDLDILVRFSKTRSLLELVRIERELSEELGRKVDLLTEASISPHLIDRIKMEMKVFYGKA